MHNPLHGGIDQKAAPGFAMGRGVAVDAGEYPAGHADVDPFETGIEQNAVNPAYNLKANSLIFSR